MKKTLFLVVFTSFLIGSTQSVAASKVWEKEFTSEPSWQRLTPNGNLLVSEAAGLSAYSGPSGDQLWVRNDVWAQTSSDIKSLGQSGLVLVEPIPEEMLGKKRKKRPKRKKDEFQSFTAVDLSTGEDQWTLDFLRGEMVGIRVIDQDEIALVFQTVKVKSKDESGIYLTAVRLANGDILWETQFADRRAKLSGKTLSGLIAHGGITLDGGVAYIPFLGVHAVDMDTGRIKWASPFRKKLPEHLDSYAAPLVNGSTVYASDTGVVYAFNKETGEQLWRAKVKRAGAIPELRQTDSVLLARFGGTFSNGRKIEQLRSPGVAAIDPSSGEVRWNFDDARDGITNLLVQEDRNRIIFADGVAVIGLSIDKGQVQFAAPLAFYRQYGIFKAKKSGFAIAGGYSKTTPAGTSGESGGFGGGGCSFDLGDLPIDITMKGEEIVIRGQSHIMTFDPRVMLVQWSAIFSETDPYDRTLLYTGELPRYSQKGLSYYLTEMVVGRGRSEHEQFIILGVDKEDGKVKSRVDIPGKDPRVIIDHGRDLLYVMNDGKKKSMQLAAYAL